MILIALNRAFWILVIASVIGGVMWLNDMDRQVEQASLEAYCTGVATWQAQAARGIAPEARTGHPDYHDKAADICPELRPAGPADENQRQLANH